MEQSIPKGVDLKILECCRRIPAARQHMVPLQRLMQHDAIEESTDAKA